MKIAKRMAGDRGDENSVRRRENAEHGPVDEMVGQSQGSNEAVELNYAAIPPGRNY